MEESVGPLKSFLVNLDEGFQMILDTTSNVPMILFAESKLQVLTAYLGYTDTIRHIWNFG
jgi:hypothetical protein